MEPKNGSKMEDLASKANGLAANAGAKIAEVARRGGDVALDAQGKVEQLTMKGGHRLQETAKKAAHVAEEIATRMKLLRLNKLLRSPTVK